MAEFVQRLESPYSNGLGAGQPLTEALDKVDVSSAEIEPVQRSQSSSSKDLAALDKPDSGIDPTSKTDFQSNIFPSLPAPRSSEPRLASKPGVAPKVGDFVMTPAGQGIVRMTYPNGQFGVDLEGGRSFSAWSASEITVLRFGT